jgi:hypothetical protein
MHRGLSNMIRYRYDFKGVTKKWKTSLNNVIALMKSCEESRKFTSFFGGWVGGFPYAPTFPTWK